MLTYTQIRNKYLEFLKSKGHREIVNSSLVPEDDSSLLFTNSGMFPIAPFLMGEKHPLGKRLTNVQRCVRTDDIEEVGDASHCTAFEMIGNWSLNDYFKKDALIITYEFLVEILGIPAKQLYGTVFEGNENAPKDESSIEILKEIFAKYGIKAGVGKGERIQLYGANKNWWGLSGGGPCGPTSEVFIDTGKEYCGDSCHVNCDCGKYVELGNNVFMQFLLKNGEYKPLGMENVDFGGGLERIAAVVQGKTSIYEIDIMLPIFNVVASLTERSRNNKFSNSNSNEQLKSQRIITDHIKSATWLIMDGVIPGNNQQNYILRRLLRRSIRHGRKLGIEGNFLVDVAKVAIEQYKEIYPELEKRSAEIFATIEKEERVFNQTLKSGEREFEKLLSKNGSISGADAFKLYESYGFPIELTLEMAKEKNLDISLKEFERAKREHIEKSRTASKGLFKGGLTDTSEQTIKLHTATHLLLKALKIVLGDHIYQKGSNITVDRLRLDFPHKEKITDEQLIRIEEIVNEQIKKALPVTFKEYSRKDALKLVKDATFKDRYGDVVKVYIIGDESNPFSVEICRGPHVKNTEELGEFKIIKEESVGSGIRRIKAKVS